MQDQRPHLTAEQRTRIEFARRDLTEARTVDLAALPASHLILQVVRLRSRLDDALRLIGDITEP